MVSPYAKRGYVDHETSEFSSILAFIESNWGLAPLTHRDKNTSDMMGAFDFTQPAREPVLLDMRRNVEPREAPRSEPVYTAYTSAVGVTFVLLVFAAYRTRKWRKSMARLEGEPG